MLSSRRESFHSCDKGFSIPLCSQMRSLEHRLLRWLSGVRSPGRDGGHGLGSADPTLLSRSSEPAHSSQNTPLVAPMSQPQDKCPVTYCTLHTASFFPPQGHWLSWREKMIHLHTCFEKSGRHSRLWDGFFCPLKPPPTLPQPGLSLPLPDPQAHHTHKHGAT